jgi:hypothetical protein
MYSARNRFSDSVTEYKGVFVDEDAGKVVSVRLSRDGWMSLDASYSEELMSLLALGSMILAVLIVMVFFRTWCQSVTDAEDSR